MTRIIFTLLALMFVLSGGPLFAAGVEHLNLGDSNLALAGYDPVTYHDGTPRVGKESLVLEYGSAQYRFSSEETRTRFQENPDTFLPAFGGWCAWAMLTGEKVKVDPERFKLVNGVTYLYYNTFFTDTLDKWNDLAAKESEPSLVKRANEKWNAITAGE